MAKVSKNSNYKDWTMLIARVFLAAIFAMSAWGKITGFSSNSAYAASSWVPLPGELLIVVAILMEVFGVVTLVSGWKMKEGAYVLAVYTFLTIIMFHYGSGQMMAALKNLAIVGGLLSLSMQMPGKFGCKSK